MSKQALEAFILNRIKKIEGREVPKLLSEYSRRWLESSKVRQVIIIRKNSLKVFARMAEELGGTLDLDVLLAELQAIHKSSGVLKKQIDAEAPYFSAFLRRHGYIWGKTALYIPGNFATAQNRILDLIIGTVNPDIDKKTGRKLLKKSFHLDHGIGNVVGQAAQGAAPLAVSTAINELGYDEKSLLKAIRYNFDQILKYTDDELNNREVRLSAHRIITKWASIATQQGTFAADLVIALEFSEGQENISTGASTEAKFYRRLMTSIADAIQGQDLADEILNLKGSNSPKEKIEKLIVKDIIADKINSTKSVKVRKNISIKSGKSKTDTKVTVKGTDKTFKTPKVRRGPARDPKTGRFISKAKAQSPYNILAMLNAKLPDVVASNMNKPALVYRTGRFASGVKAVDISKTAKGFLSIGYTYQKYPYQTFEPGFAQGSVERDPRTLIDKSIREIAAEMALGRFYTRRI